MLFVWLSLQFDHCEGWCFSKHWPLAEQPCWATAVMRAPILREVYRRGGGVRVCKWGGKMFILFRGSLLAARKILKYGILRMARNASKIFMASIRKNFLFNNNDPLVGFWIQTISLRVTKQGQFYQLMNSATKNVMQNCYSVALESIHSLQIKKNQFEINTTLRTSEPKLSKK